MRGFGLVSVLVLMAAACGSAKKPPVDPSAENSKEDMGSDWTASAPVKSPPPSETPSESSDSSPPPNSASSKGAHAAASTPTSAGTPAAHAADAGPHVPSSVGGSSYDRASLEIVLKRAARQVKANCGAATDESGNATGPWGKSVVTVKLGHNGHSKSGTVPAPYDGKASGNCAAKAFGNLIYEPFAGSDTDVDWPIEIVKP